MKLTKEQKHQIASESFDLLDAVNKTCGYLEERPQRFKTLKEHGWFPKERYGEEGRAAWTDIVSEYIVYPYRNKWWWTSSSHGYVDQLCNNLEHGQRLAEEHYKAKCEDFVKRNMIS